MFLDDVAPGKFEVQNEAALINPDAMAALKPKLHFFQGLKHLIERRVFVDNDGSSEIVRVLQASLGAALSKNGREQIEKGQKSEKGKT